MCINLRFRSDAGLRLCNILRFAPLPPAHAIHCRRIRLVLGIEFCAASPTPDEAALIEDAAEYASFGFSRKDVAQWLDMSVDDMNRRIDTHRDLFRSHRPYERVRERFDGYNDDSARLERELEVADTPWKIVRAADRLARRSFQFIAEEIRCRWRLFRHRKRSRRQPVGPTPLSYERLNVHIEQTVAALNTFGIGRNDRVAIVLPNGPERDRLSGNCIRRGQRPA